MVEGLQIVALPPGRDPVDLTGAATETRWSTAAVGGFGSCSFKLPGPPARWRRVPPLSLVRVTFGPSVLFEGQLEDVDLTIQAGEMSTTLTAYGLRRRLEQTSVKRIWSKRDLTYIVPARGTVLTGGGFGPGTPTLNRENEIRAGQFDAADLSRVGVGITCGSFDGGSTNSAFCYYLIPGGISPIRIMFDLTTTGTGWKGFIEDSTDGTNWTNRLNANVVSKTAENVALGSSATIVALGGMCAAATNIGEVCQLENIRLLCTSLTEDAAGGFYGDSILRDLISLIPDLAAGTIETGSDFTIGAVDRAVRSTALSVVQEVALYYSREWAIWESQAPGVGRFDWVTPPADPVWLLSLADLSSLQIQQTIDTAVRTVYINYLDAATLQAGEGSAVSTDQRNPTVKAGKAKDVTAQVSFPMTSATATQLASKLAADQGGYPPVRGSITIPATRLLARAAGSPRPAWTVRAGENIVISDLPATSSGLRTSSRDGEQVFHLVSTDTDLAKGMVTLELEGQEQRSDVLLARLASATRTVTG